MFEPNEDEARRAEALNQAIMSTSSTETHIESLYNRGTQLILDRAAQIETYLRQGGEIKLSEGETVTRSGGAFGAYQERGLDNG